MTAPDTVPAVTLERVAAAMAGLGVELEATDGAPAASANLNGFPVTFAALGSVAIVRTDSLTDVPTAAGDAALYLAANHLNSIQMEASVAIVDYAETLIVRTEHEIFAAPGLTDAQLTEALRTAVDGVLRVQDAVKVTAEQFSAARDDRPEQ